MVRVYGVRTRIRSRALVKFSLENVRSLVIEFKGGVGDLLMLTPVLKAIKSAYPQIEITYITDKKSVLAMIQRLRVVDKGFFFKERRTIDWLRAFWMFYKKDLAWFIGRKKRIVQLAQWAGVAHRIGQASNRANYLTDILPSEGWMQYAYLPYTYAMFWKQISRMDITDTEDWWKIDYPLVNEAERQRMELILRKHSLNRYIVCSLKTSSPEKDWPISHWLALFAKMPDKTFVIVGEAGDTKGVDLPNHVIDLTGQTNLVELGYLIQKAELVINSSSLPIHIAAAFDIPSIILYGSVAVNWDLPRKYYAYITSPLACSPCIYPYPHGAYSLCEKPDCMAAISVDDVYNQVQAFYTKKDLEWKSVQKEWMWHESCSGVRC